MPKSTMQKFRAIEILRILQEESDSDHPITTQDFCKKLEEKGITCDRRTLSDDISDLVELGYAISSKNIGKQKGYFYDGFMFSIEELKVLIDAVQASSFIPEKQSKELMEKLATWLLSIPENTKMKVSCRMFVLSMTAFPDIKKSRSITMTWTRIKRKDIERTESVT